MDKSEVMTRHTILNFAVTQKSQIAIHSPLSGHKHFISYTHPIKHIIKSNQIQYTTQMYMDKKYKGYNKLESYTIQATQKYLCMHTEIIHWTKNVF